MPKLYFFLSGNVLVKFVDNSTDYNAVIETGCNKNGNLQTFEKVDLISICFTTITVVFNIKSSKF